MDLPKLKTQLRIHEGVRTKAYKDTLGFVTVGVGHLVKKSDNIKLGETISKERVEELFEQDLAEAIKTAEKFLYKIDLNETKKAAIVNMCFNLGPKIFQFRKFQAALLISRFDIAANEMCGSLWAKQVGNRAKELAQIIASK